MDFNEDAKRLLFRIMKLQFFLSLDNLSGFVGISTNNTYGPNLGYRQEKKYVFKAKDFWMGIMRLDSYEARSVKASQIIHRMLSVSLQIFFNVVFPTKT